MPSLPRARNGSGRPELADGYLWGRSRGEGAPARRRQFADRLAVAMKRPARMPAIVGGTSESVHDDHGLGRLRRDLSAAGR